MSGFIPKRNATLLMPSGPSGNHLFVISTNKGPDAEYLLLSFSTIRAGRYYDPTCVVAAGVHEFIQSPSYVVYRAPRVEREAHLLRMESTGLFFGKVDLDEALTDRVCAGIEISEHTPNFALKFYRNYLRMREA